MRHLVDFYAFYDAVDDSIDFFKTLQKCPFSNLLINKNIDF
jgi:hypothetical protein